MAAKKSKTRKSTPIQIGRRELWLAGLGAVSLVRKQAEAVLATARSRGAELNARAVALRETARVQAADAIEQAVDRADAVLQPLLARIGRATAPKSAKPRGSARKATRRASRKTARAA